MASPAISAGASNDCLQFWQGKISFIDSHSPLTANGRRGLRASARTAHDVVRLRSSGISILAPSIQLCYHRSANL